jgi:hypothetical protein
MENLDRQISKRIDTIDDERTRRYIDDAIKKQVSDYLKSTAFTGRKLTDTPTDALQVVNRKYVTMNGVTASRPTSSVLGQFYYDTSLDRPIWLGNGGVWKKADGTSV